MDKSMPSRRLLLVVELEIDHEARVQAQSATELLVLAKELLSTTPLPPHVRWNRILGFPAPVSLSSQHEQLLAMDSEAVSPDACTAMSEAQLLKFIIELQKARGTLEERCGYSIDSMCLQQAQVELLRVPSCEFLPERNLSAEQMVSLLEGYHFAQTLERVRAENTFIPRGLSTRLDEERRKMKGEQWEIHKNDVDPWPSDPHAHNVETGYKLNLATGDLHNPRKRRNESFLKRMPKKQLLALRSLFTTPLPDLDIG